MEVNHTPTTISPEHAPQSSSDSPERIYQIAQTLYDQGTDWSVFFREVLGMEGIVRKNCQEPESREEFEKTPVYSDIQQMLAQLRNRRGQDAPEEPTRVITVRMPASLHEALKAESKEHRTSMNKLCISKLLQPIEDTLVPHDA